MAIGNEPDLMRLIQIKFSRLSKGQKLIAEYILNNYDKAAFMTAAKLGASVGVSESTVVRFAIKSAVRFTRIISIVKQVEIAEDIIIP